MRALVAVTDRQWFEHLSHAGTLDEVNFWQPSSGNTFQAVQLGEALVFKLHSPDNFIVGGGVFSHWTKLRVSLRTEQSQEVPLLVRQQESPVPSFTPA